MTFTDFNLIDPINNAISDLGFSTPSEIQHKVIPILQSYKGDFVGQAQTGTGKTAAFVIPLLEQIDFTSKHVQAVILAPTRELANQVYEEVKKLGKYLPLKATTVYGGVSYTKQIDSLRRDRPQIVVGTPGRMIDLINKNILKLSECKNMVIDEADEMLNMGFIDDVQTIIDALNPKKTMWMFSATMPRPIVKFINERFSQTKMVKDDTNTLSKVDIDKFYCVVNRQHFTEALQRIIDSEKECYGMIFCETRLETKNLSERLLDKGVSCVALHGELNQGQRDFAMRRFKEKKVDFLICTDVAARGIDVNNITHVFTMGLPRQSESYIHRIGRTGRAGLKGTAISFITPSEIRKLRQIEAMIKEKINPFKLPNSNDLKKIKVFKELDKMETLKTAIVKKEDAFMVDSSYEYFRSYFKDLSKEQILKLMFSFKFNKDIRHIDDHSSLDVVANFSADRSNKNRRSSSRRRSNDSNSNNRSNNSSGSGAGSRNGRKDLRKKRTRR